MKYLVYRNLNAHDNLAKRWSLCTLGGSRGDDMRQRGTVDGHAQYVTLQGASFITIAAALARYRQNTVDLSLPAKRRGREVFAWVAGDMLPGAPVPAGQGVRVTIDVRPGGDDCLVAVYPDGRRVPVTGADYVRFGDHCVAYGVR